MQRACRLHIHTLDDFGGPTGASLFVYYLRLQVVRRKFNGDLLLTIRGLNHVLNRSPTRYYSLAAQTPT